MVACWCRSPLQKAEDRNGLELVALVEDERDGRMEVVES